MTLKGLSAPKWIPGEMFSQDYTQSDSIAAEVVVKGGQMHDELAESGSFYQAILVLQV